MANQIIAQHGEYIPAANAAFQEMIAQQRAQTAQARETMQEIRASIIRQNEEQTRQALEMAAQMQQAMQAQNLAQAKANSEILGTLQELIREVRALAMRPANITSGESKKGDTLHGALLISLIAVPLGMWAFNQHTPIFYVFALFAFGVAFIAWVQVLTVQNKTYSLTPAQHKFARNAGLMLAFLFSVWLTAQAVLGGWGCL